MFCDIKDAADILVNQSVSEFCKQDAQLLLRDHAMRNVTTSTLTLPHIVTLTQTQTQMTLTILKVS